MSMMHLLGRRFPAFVLGGLSLVAVPVIAPAGPPEAPPIVAPAEAPAKPLTLEDCLRIASEHQPNLAAARASLNAAIDGRKAVDNLSGTAVLLAPDLPVRRKQACLGVAIAEAALRQTEFEVEYAVTRLYYTVLYAQSQVAVTNEVVDRFRFYEGQVKELVKKPDAPKELNEDSVNKITVYLNLADGKRVEAAQGVNRAKAALREAMGLCGDTPLEIAEAPWPETTAELTRPQVVATARALRPEIVQAHTAAELFQLEVDAQAKHCLPGKVPTFAAGGDIHARPVPQDRINGEYHPGAIPPEMPVMLVGSKSARVERAKDFADKAQAVAAKADHLIVLEAEDSFYRWDQAVKQLAAAEKGAKAGKSLADNTDAAFRKNQAVKVDELLTNAALGAQAQGSYNEARYQHLLALAQLQRVTVGSFPAHLTNPPKKD